MGGKFDWTRPQPLLRHGVKLRPLAPLFRVVNIFGTHSFQASNIYFPKQKSSHWLLPFYELLFTFGLYKMLDAGNGNFRRLFPAIIAVPALKFRWPLIGYEKP